LPIMFEKKGPHTEISLYGLCGPSTEHLCDITKRMLRVLSIYHLYINQLSSDTSTDGNSQDETALQEQSQSVLAFIHYHWKVDDYSATELASDVHHFREYHIANRRFVRNCREHLVELNADGNDFDRAELLDIAERIESEETLFVQLQTMDDEKAMVRSLNRLHRDIHANADDPELDALDADTANAVGSLTTSLKHNLRVSQYEKAHFRAQESLELGSLTPAGYRGSNGMDVVLPDVFEEDEDDDEEDRLAAEQRLGSYPDTPGSMFADDYEVDR